MVSPNIIFAVLMGCPTTQVTNLTDEWNKQDSEAIATATKTCSRDRENPCLKKFKKIEEGLYSALCGVPNGK